VEQGPIKAPVPRQRVAIALLENILFTAKDVSPVLLASIAPISCLPAPNLAMGNAMPALVPRREPPLLRTAANAKLGSTLLWAVDA